MSLEKINNKEILNGSYILSNLNNKIFIDEVIGEGTFGKVKLGVHIIT
jgi:hypothetical protein